MTEKQQSKRDFLKKSVYVVPAILTLEGNSCVCWLGLRAAETGTMELAMARSPAPGNPPWNNGSGSGPGNPEKKFKKFKFGRKNRA